MTENAIIGIVVTMCTFVFGVLAVMCATVAEGTSKEWSETLFCVLTFFFSILTVAAVSTLVWYIVWAIKGFPNS